MNKYIDADLRKELGNYLTDFLKNKIDKYDCSYEKIGFKFQADIIAKDTNPLTTIDLLEKLEGRTRINQDNKDGKHIELNLFNLGVIEALKEAINYLMVRGIN